VSVLARQKRRARCPVWHRLFGGDLQDGWVSALARQKLS
jgi:hypothetical protein